MCNVVFVLDNYIQMSTQTYIDKKMIYGVKIQLILILKKQMSLYPNVKDFLKKRIITLSVSEWIMIYFLAYIILKNEHEHRQILYCASNF